MEEIVRKLLLLGVSALMFASFVVDEASAQRGFGGGGFRGGGGFSGGGFRGGFGGGGFRGGFGGYRGGVIGGGYRGGVGWGGPRVGFAGRGYAPYRGYGYGYRRGYGWGWPLAAGLGIAAAATTYGYYDSCTTWNGYAWVNVCYAPSYYGYAPPF
jgi:hypothetical protein